MNKYAIVGFFALLLTILSQPVWAGCERESTATAIDNSELIFVGKVKGKEYVGYNRAKTSPGEVDKIAAENGEAPLWKWKINEFEVEQAFKGSTPNLVRVVSPRFYNLGSRYLVFADRADNKSRYEKTQAGWVNTTCHKSESLSGVATGGLLEEVDAHFNSMKLK